VVQTGLQESLTVQQTPQADGPEMVLRRQRLMSEAADNLLRPQINVCENHDLAFLLLQHLGAPAGFPACVEALAANQYS
jgi:hypothetical protein